MRGTRAHPFARPRVPAQARSQGAAHGTVSMASAEGTDCLPRPAVMLLLMQPRTLLTTFPARAHCCLVNLASTRQPWHVLVSGVVPPQGQDSAFLPAEQHKVLLSPRLQPIQVPWDSSMTLWCYRPLLLALCQLLRVHSTPWSIINILMKMLNTIIPHTNPQDAPPVTGLQLDFMSWITATFQPHLSNLGFAT